MNPHDSRIDRRTLLRRVGVAMGLPWLESMPVWGGDIAAQASSPPRRFAALFMGNGISPDHWWAKGTGAAMELGKSLQPLAPFKSKLNLISGLFNKHATGVGIHPGQTGNILSGSPLASGGEIRSASLELVVGKAGDAVQKRSLQPGER